MKILYLLRHAKSSWSQPGLGDKGRPLNSRGRKNAPHMGKRFSERGESVDRVISSPAKRAHDTAMLFTENCGYQRSIQIHDGLYFLGSGSIEELILQQDNQLESLMLVFHNPDITHFSNSLDYDLSIDNVPTCGLLRFECETDDWQQWTKDVTRFDYFDYPKNESDAVVRA